MGVLGGPEYPNVLLTVLYHCHCSVGTGALPGLWSLGLAQNWRHWDGFPKPHSKVGCPFLSFSLQEVKLLRLRIQVHGIPLALFLCDPLFFCSEPLMEPKQACLHAFLMSPWINYYWTQSWAEMGTKVSWELPLAGTSSPLSMGISYFAPNYSKKGS